MYPFRHPFAQEPPQIWPQPSCTIRILTRAGERAKERLLVGLLEAVAAGRAKRKSLVSKSKTSPLPFLPVHKGRDVGAPDTI